MSNVCFQKCVQKYGDPDLHIGEMSCIDRCTMKYLETQNRVGERIQKMQMEALADKDIQNLPRGTEDAPK